MTSYQVEKYSEIVSDIKAIYRLHYDEIAEHKEVTAFGPDYENYQKMDDAGNMIVITVRESGELIGYMQIFIIKHLHYISVLSASADIYYIKKEFRQGSRGIGLFNFAVEEMKRRKVGRFYASCKLKHDVGPLLERVGFEPIERNYMMVL
ncbi:MAG: hypothetical protein B7Z60_10165 [Ferrovum sp. 37-45-19]|nr:MAG: hypothetical protein B7Z60_10165 [Ferrovum sp. 37-45-19]